MQTILIILMCVLAAVCYGVLQDQVTARVCVEYFTIGHVQYIRTDSSTLLGLYWGVVATWWVGLPLGVLMAAAARVGKRPKLSARSLMKPVVILMGVIGAFALVAGIAGFIAARNDWVIIREGTRLAARLPLEKHDAFLANLWAHIAAYYVGAIGGVVLCVVVWMQRRTAGARAEEGPEATDA